MGNDLVTELLPTLAFLCVFTFHNGSKTKYYVNVKQRVTFIFRFLINGLFFYQHFVHTGRCIAANLFVGGHFMRFLWYFSKNV